MAILRDAVTGQIVAIADCELLRYRTSLFCFFVRAPTDVVLGARYRLEYEGEE